MNMGVLAPDRDFLQRVWQLCTRYGTLLIIDEVACGFGRTGRLFACEHFGVVPDVMCLAKAITGGYAGMGATIVTDEVADKVKDDVSVWSSYGWHPLSVAAATANLRYIKANRKRLLANVNSLKRASIFVPACGRYSAPTQRFACGAWGLAIAVELGDE
jgi:adenosylmethionine-8-amino-7-oxononanoate aminotransferase